MWRKSNEGVLLKESPEASRKEDSKKDDSGKEERERGLGGPRFWGSSKRTGGDEGKEKRTP